MDRDEFEEYIHDKANDKILPTKDMKLANCFRKVILPEVLSLLNMFKELKNLDEKTSDIMFVSIMMLMFSQYGNNTDDILDKLKKVREMFVSIETDFNKES